MRRATVAVALMAAAFGLGACGDSPEDQAREDGERVGEAVRAIFDAPAKADAEEAIQDLKYAVTALHSDAKKRVQAQVDTQRQTLEDAAGGGIAGLKEAVQTVRAQADAFRSGNNSIANEFWRGFEDGYDGDT